MSKDFGSGWMASTAAGYQTKVTIVSPTPGQTVKIVSDDPRRWYLRIASTTAGGTTAPVAPFPATGGAAQIIATPLPIEVKYRDAPSLCTGAWFCFSPGALQFSIWEVFYLGE